MIICKLFSYFIVHIVFLVVDLDVYMCVDYRRYEKDEHKMKISYVKDTFNI